MPVMAKLICQWPVHLQYQVILQKSLKYTDLVLMKHFYFVIIINIENSGAF